MMATIGEAPWTRWLERDLVPDQVIRMGIRRLLAARLAEERSESVV